MIYLDEYLKQFEVKGQHELALSIKKTATEVGSKYLSQFDYISNKIGLLFGNIQSGKTGHMFGIASEAADRGFPYFLLLETDSNLLQQQTYSRAKRDLTEFVVCDENEEQKFRDHGSKPVMVVLKKNSRVLKSWVDRFKNSQMLKGNPLFILDDEADAVSLNTKINQKKQSTINKYLEMIRDTALSSIYLQVTGTPQSILLQTQQSNWNPMFTYYFNPGKDYLGGDFFFPNADKTPNFVQLIDERSPLKVAEDAVLRHLVVSAQVLLSGNKVSNCIVHPGIKQSDHESARNDIEKALIWWTFHHSDQNFIDNFKREYDLISPRKSIKQPYDKILNKVLVMLEKHLYSTIVLNGTTNDGSDEYETGCNFIIGGTNLGRGVTFGQLNTFIYTRTSKSPQADTMWQHSRMFGYDRDPGLISIYCSKRLYNLFAQINDTNNSIINQVRRGLKIKIAYPGDLKPTRSNVLDKSLLDILVGGSNHFPFEPQNDTYEQIEELLSNFTDTNPAQKVSLNFVIEVLKHIKTEKNFNMAGYINIIKSELASNSLEQGYLLVKRDRDITHGSRALLSPNDWDETNKHENSFVLTMYRVLGQKSKGWNGEKIWIPNIKLPKSKNFYII
ncbi:hypothetical protein JCM15457_459 [Liquorilactobacillus sucicola DSM 21376 = JCM 15457]|uniref:Putative endonuclease Z1 domain-containing protein n=1 Tax=Liquorilactobacillus sucicola DSM 21376 = JCM 15457 TaxID=1423806 RepID=A0A023CUU6_9LACO|nr:Z1 domain-containing protein [Liquorilactobacillus sucicola]KRN05507.1 hypothetical protein FD15_GL002063 [Liquorilactobacillus sucicola DSM 21376 = JCM 15457]GAJ25589.1 hypothetical protein JCM15457_459 [Liquorilactobacillus sucicola DSM 21376 = JCM 15457]